MKKASYSIVHYGVDYLSYSLRSVYDLMDELHVLYTSHPSHGHRTDIPPIESREQLREVAFDYDPRHKIIWHDTDFWNEGQQRDYAVNMLDSRGVDLITVLDYDEVWHDYVLDKVLQYVWNLNATRNNLINFLHFWRSFNYACKDNNWPVRIIDTRHSGGIGYVPTELGDIMHMGYAITDKVCRYKIQIHGHKDEIRPNWYDEKWMAWPPVDDCHPTNGRNDEGIGWWNPKPFDKRELPYVLHSHPWFNAEKIE